MGGTIQFFYAIGSRYSYLASSRLEALANEAGAAIEWLPLNSVRLLAERGYSPFDHVEVVRGQYSPEYRELDARRWAQFYGVPFHEPRGRIELDSELLALAATAGKRLGKARELTVALFAAVFHGQIARIDRAECVQQARSLGIEPASFERCLTSEATAAELEKNMQLAHASGIFGVPTFVVDGEQYWGNDRLLLLAKHLEWRGQG